MRSIPVKLYIVNKFAYTIYGRFWVSFQVENNNKKMGEKSSC